MTYETLKKEVIGFLDDRLAQINNFIRSLKTHNPPTNSVASSIGVANNRN